MTSRQASRVAAICWIVLGPVLASAAAAQATAPATDSARKFEITDNSFLVEEAFNQEPRIFQNILSWAWSKNGDWTASFTQEWPLFSKTHQLSYTIPLSRGDAGTGINDVLLNYRYQVWDETERHPALSPRLSVVLPTGNARDGFGSDVVGLQVNVPFSKQVRDFYFHWNAGWTWLPRVASSERVPTFVNLTSPQLAGSVIWRLSPMVNLMLETVWQFEESVDTGPGVVSDRRVIISPGFRRGWNVGNRQIVVGAATPITHENGDASAALLTYFSYELPFKQ
jgi:hypothetical protein